MTSSEMFRALRNPELKPADGSTKKHSHSQKMQCSMDWFKGKFTGKSRISWEDRWFPVVDFANQSIEVRGPQGSLRFFVSPRESPFGHA